MSAGKAEEQKVQGVKCKASVSLIPNNLQSNNNYVSYIHKNELYLMENKASVFSAERAEPPKSAYGEKDAISQSLWCKMGLGEVLIIISISGHIHVYNDNGRSLLHSHKLQKSQVALSAKDSMLRGIAHDGHSLLFIGTGSGEILMFHLSAKKFTLLKKLDGGHGEPISDIIHTASSSTPSLNPSNLLIVADEGGMISYWSPSGEEDYKKIGEYKSGNGIPIQCLSMGYGCIIVADSTGHIKIFDAEKKYLKVEIAAHARAINALDIHPTKGFFAVAAEDSWISVWTIPTTKSPAVKNIHISSPAAALLTGIRFAGPDHNLLLVSAYDSRYIFSLPSP